ncbi:hypothetical protein BB560_006889 [Smittium megazygosporum]|uniref:NADH dehydrogenase [ubiquinone] 1 alpha subcomplex subunit n=1 Tax=Smittium megazygosporum TaxID=133381 RepID=A0A2T9Y0J7_9FUNG|nr:hypothetical protein BB560_006889 [Smittium megazygosporum]
MIKNFFKSFEKTNFPWSKTRYIGSDYNGNLYFEKYRAGTRPRRIVKYNESKVSFQYDALKLPIQWQSWLRHTRPEPPTEKEIQDDLIRIENLREKVKAIEFREQKDREEYKKLAG